MIILYPKSETVFERNGLGDLSEEIIQPEVTWEMNGRFDLSFEYPSHLPLAEHLTPKNIVKSPVPFMADQPFRIYRVTKTLGTLFVEARHIFYDLADNLIEDTYIVRANGDSAVRQILRKTQYPHLFQGSSNLMNTASSRLVRKNVVEALLNDDKDNSFVNRWGGELWRDGYRFSMQKRIGTDRGVTIEHRKDLLGYEAVFDESTVVTRIMPQGFDGLFLPEKYVDSPLIDKHHPKIKVVRFDNIKAKTKDNENDEEALPLEEAYAKLKSEAKRYFDEQQIDRPETTIKVDFVTLHNTTEYEEFSVLQEVHAGDTVRVKAIEDNFSVESRLVGFTSNPLLKDHYTRVQLGSHTLNYTGDNVSIQSLKNAIQDIKQNVTTIMESADGRSKNYFGEDNPNVYDPENIILMAKPGDYYFQTFGDYEGTWLYVEKEGQFYWELLVDNKMDERLQSLIKETQEEMDKINEEVEANKSAQDAKIEAFENKVNSDLSEIRSDFNLSLDQIEQRVFNNESNYSSIVQRVNGIQSEVFDSLGNSKITQLSTLIEQKVSQDDVMSIVRQDANSIWQAVTDKSGKVLSEINQYDGSVRIKGDLIHLSGKSLIDDAVIKSSHIQSLTADKINTGTLNAANVNIINLNANKIVGLDSTFMRTKWNAATGGNVTIDGNGLKSKSTLGYYAEMSGGRFEMWNERNEKLGMLGTQKDIDEPLHRYLSVGIEYNKGFSISKKETADANAYTRILTIRPSLRRIEISETLMVEDTVQAFSLETSGKVVLRDSWDGWSVRGVIGGFSKLDDGMYIGFNRAVNFGYHATPNAGGITFSTKFKVMHNALHAFTTLNMNNYSIINQSDARLKKNIHEITFSPLEIVEQLKGKEYEWISSDAPKGVQFGLIAQEVRKVFPNLVNDRDEYLAIDNTRLNMLTTLALAELANKTKGELDIIHQRLKHLEEKVGSYGNQKY